jgi:hypothetical protein
MGSTGSLDRDLPPAHKTDHVNLRQTAAGMMVAAPTVRAGQSAPNRQTES